jgi:hypothetical protein
MSSRVSVDSSSCDGFCAGTNQHVHNAITAFLYDDAGIGKFEIPVVADSLAGPGNEIILSLSVGLVCTCQIWTLQSFSELGRWK